MGLQSTDAKYIIPKILGTASNHGEVIKILPFDNRGTVTIEVSKSNEELNNDLIVALLKKLDGSLTLSDACSAIADLSCETVLDLLSELDKVGLIDELSVPEYISGLEFLLDLELFVESLLAKGLYKNKFWQQCLTADSVEDFPKSVVIGLVLENYHFLSRESLFDAPVLSYVANSAVRLAINRFYSEEYGHDEILLRALNSAGLSSEEVLSDIVPLPETLALCNSLAFWSNYDPIFFFTTLGILEGQSIGRDSFIEACERIGIDDGIVCHVKAHAEINATAGHGNVTREIFASIQALDLKTCSRIKAQTHLFVELYDQFYTAVWEHYSLPGDRIRRISCLESV